MISSGQRLLRLASAVGPLKAVKVSVTRIVVAPITGILRAIFAKEIAGTVRRHMGDAAPVIIRSTLPYAYPYRQRVHHVADALIDAGRVVLFVSPDLGYDDFFLWGNPRPGLFLLSGDIFIQCFPEAPLYILSTDGDFDDLDVAAWSSSGRRMIYDYIDHFDDAVSSSRISAARRRAHDALLRDENRTLVACSARRLMAEVAAVRNRNMAYVPNGVELQRFEGVSRSRDRLRPDFETILDRGRPIIGYYGALAEWFDYRLVADMAESLVECDIVIFGLDLDGSGTRLPSAPNIFVLPPMPYGDLPRHAIWFDVCLIPFVLNDITTATSPLKMFEYMALGRPTVTTGIPDCAGYTPAVVTADRGKFVKAVQEALERGRDPEFSALARSEARKHDWAQRATTILDAYSMMDTHGGSAAAKPVQETEAGRRLVPHRLAAIVPVFNRSDSVPIAISSILRQEVPNLEVIVVDDGSIPPLELPSEIAADPRVRVIRSEENKGPAAARNLGILSSSADWIAFLDSDDVWLQGKLLNQFEAIDREGAESCVVTGFRRLKSTDEPWEILFPRSGKVADDFLGGCWFCPGSTALMHRSIFDRVGLFDEHLRRLEDTDWYIRLGLTGGTVISVSTVGAEIRATSIPSRKHVDDACRHLFKKWILSDQAKLTGRQKRRLAAYLFLERASVRYKAQNPLTAGWMFLLSLFLAPRLRIQIKNWWKRYDIGCSQNLTWNLRRGPFDPRPTGTSRMVADDSTVNSSRRSDQ